MKFLATASEILKTLGLWPMEISEKQRLRHSKTQVLRNYPKSPKKDSKQNFRNQVYGFQEKFYVF